MLPFLWKQRQDTVWLSVVYHPLMCHQLLGMKILLPFLASHTVWLGLIGSKSWLLFFFLSFFKNVGILRYFELYRLVIYTFHICFSYLIFPGSEGF